MVCSYSYNHKDTYVIKVTTIAITYFRPDAVRLIQHNR